MKKLTLLLLTMLSVASMAQNNYFEKKLLWHFFQDAWIVDTQDKGYVIGGRTITNNTNDTYLKSYLAFLDQLGDSTHVTEYARPNTDVFLQDFLQNELGFALLIVIDVNPDEGTEDHALFMQTDSLGNSLFEHIISDTLHFNALEKMIRTPEDNGYLAIGRIRSVASQGFKPYIVKLNANGEKQWEKIINDYNPNLDSRLFDVVHTNEGYFAVGSINSNSDTGVGDIILAKINLNNGDFLDEWVYDFDDYYNTSGFDWGYTLFPLTDGGFVIGGGNQTTPQFGYLLRLDSNKNQVWLNDSINYDCSVRKIVPLPDGSFVTTGCATVLYPEVSNGVQVEISKVSATGNLLWKRHYGVDGADDYAWDMINTPDGGFMVVGRSYSFFWQQTPIYLLKTNCMGLLTQPQAAFAAQMDTAALRATFQNLSQYTYPDSIDGGHYIWDFGDGATSTDINPTHTYAQGGNYTVTLTAVVCSDTSVFVQEVSTYAVGINQVLPLEGGGRGGLYTVLPNPAQDYLVINSQTSTTNATFVLYDVLGREQLRQNLSSPSFGGGKGEATIATKHLPSGIYLYQIINPQNQTLQYGKVSILH